MTRKIVILVTIDCLRYDYIEEVLKAIPRKWGKIIFHNHYANAPYTWASFVALFTSTPPFLVCSTSLKKRISFTEFLSNQGYITIGINGGNPYLALEDYQRIFNHYINILNHKENNINKIIIRKLRRLATNIINKMHYKIGYVLYSVLECMYSSSMNVLFRGENPIINAHLTILKALMSLVRAMSSNKKGVFLWIHIMDLHFPYNNYVRLKEGVLNTSKFIWDYVKYETLGFAINNVSHFKRLYEFSLKYVISALKMLISFIEYISKDYEIYIIITSDHGEEFLEHGALGHEGLRLPGIRFPHLYEELVHVPLIITSPSFTRTLHITQSLSSHVDLAPTILALLGIKSRRLEELFIGHNLVNIAGVNIAVYNKYNKHIYIESDAFLTNVNVYRRNQRARLAISIRDGRYKYIYHPILGEELYDLYKDPKERLNLAPLMNDIIKEFRQYIREYLLFKQKFEIMYRAKLALLGKSLIKSS